MPATTVVPVTTSSGCYSECRIEHATNFCESTFAVPSHSQPHQPRSFAFRKCSFGKKTIVWSSVWRAFQAKRFDSYSHGCTMTKLTMLHFATSANRLQLKRNDTSKVSLTRRQCMPFSLYLAVKKTVQRCCPPSMLRRKLITDICDWI